MLNVIENELFKRGNYDTGERGELLELYSEGGMSGLVLREVEVWALIRCKYNKTYFS